jgi:hypothetical protein
MMGAFADWRTKTATIKRLTTTQDAAGRPVSGETTVAADVAINYWTDSSRVTSQSDRFVDQALGSAILPAELSVDTTMWMEIDGVKHHIIGVDDVAGFGEVLLVSWRREYGE